MSQLTVLNLFGSADTSSWGNICQSTKAETIRVTAVEGRLFIFKGEKGKNELQTKDFSYLKNHPNTKLQTASKLRKSSSSSSQDKFPRNKLSEINTVSFQDTITAIMDKGEGSEQPDLTLKLPLF